MMEAAEQIQREELIKWIKKNRSFYNSVSFNGHSLKELEIIKTKIETEERKKEKKSEYLQYLKENVKNLKP
mgnify:CR=1 FL=1